MLLGTKEDNPKGKQQTKDIRRSLGSSCSYLSCLAPEQRRAWAFRLQFEAVLAPKALAQSAAAMGLQESVLVQCKGELISQMRSWGCQETPQGELQSMEVEISIKKTNLFSKMLYACFCMFCIFCICFMMFVNLPSVFLNLLWIRLIP